MDIRLQRIERSIEILGRMGRARGPGALRAARAGVTLTGSQQRLLRFVVEQSPVRISDLARWVAMPDAAVSRGVSALEEHELVERVASAEDGRVTLVRVLPEGRRIAKRLRAAADAILETRLDSWSARDLDTLARLMERLTEDLGLELPSSAERTGAS